MHKDNRIKNKHSWITCYKTLSYVGIEPVPLSSLGLPISGCCTGKKTHNINFMLSSIFSNISRTTLFDMTFSTCVVIDLYGTRNIIFHIVFRFQFKIFAIAIFPIVLWIYFCAKWALQLKLSGIKTVDNKLIWVELSFKTTFTGTESLPWVSRKNFLLWKRDACMHGIAPSCFYDSNSPMARRGIRPHSVLPINCVLK